ncbi:MAG TPA: hypothetical protein VMR16_01815 [Candidatus Saccharimonadales bacterium]|nr:hypothetical protein [Candidatus Saccharimonadales bacterium]
MVNKKQVHHGLNRLQQIKTWQLVIILILAGFVSATFLRLNNIGMVERRTAVYAADKVGDNAVTQNRLYDLQRYVSTHMNTAMGGGVFLSATYKRDAQALYEQESATGDPNGNIYVKAQQVCAPQYTSWSPAYVQCTVNQLAKYPSWNDLNNPVTPPTGPYTYAYVSPLWSPDFAGWSVLVCVVILIMIIARFIGVVILRMLLRRHYKSI